MELDWMYLIEKLFELVLFPALTVLGLYVVKYINAKLNEIKEKSDNALHVKYISMLDKTIAECVIATNQTYVESLKAQGKFDLNAQKVAFEMTYTNVLEILTEDAKEYLTTAIGDLNAYLETKIEAAVVASKLF